MKPYLFNHKKRLKMTKDARAWLTLTMLMTAVILSGCSDPQYKLGEEGGMCFPNMSCNHGLTCLSGICVRLPDKALWPFGDACYNPKKDGGIKPEQSVVDGQADKSDGPDASITPPPGTWISINHCASFFMGSPTNVSCRDPNNETHHQVSLSRRFSITSHEVSQQEFEKVMGYKPWTMKTCGKDCPVESVNWYEAAAYCNAISKNAGKEPCYTCTGTDSAVVCTPASKFAGSAIYSCNGFRLPTEAEWECAYRAGTNTQLYNGDITVCEGNDPKANAIAWYKENGLSSTHPRGQKQPNTWKLYDMAGNAMEWCHDWYQQDLGTAHAVNPAGATSGTTKVVKGGGWYNTPYYLRAAARDFNPTNKPDYRDASYGFRCVISGLPHSVQPDAGPPPDAGLSPDIGLPPDTGPKPDASPPPGTWVAVNSICASFYMGSPKNENCRNPANEDRHQVQLTNNFEISATEVTQDEFASVMGYSPWTWKTCGKDCPVESVNWHEAAAYCNTLSQNAGLEQCFACTGSGGAFNCQAAAKFSGSAYYSCKGYRLPTEAEWECAYRAGTTTPLYNGSVTLCDGNDAMAGAIGHHKFNSGSQPHPVKQKTPNALGLYDMAGNVTEWCYDWHQQSLGTTTAVNPVGPATGMIKVIKGGGWYNAPHYMRGAARDNNHANITSYRDSAYGFRCVRTTTPASTTKPAWTSMPSPTTAALRAVWGTGPSDIYAVGDGPVTLHYNGNNWAAMTLPSGVTGALSDLWGSSLSDVWAGGSAAVLRYNGAGWTKIASPTGSSGIWGSSASNVYIASGQDAYRYNGTSFTSYSVHSGGPVFMTDIWGSGATDVFILSQSVSSGGSCGAAIHRFNGTAWPRAFSTFSLGCAFALWGSGATNIFTVGTGSGKSDTHAVVNRYNGTAWAPMTTPTSARTLRDAWGSGATNVFAVGESGTILRYNGAAWSMSTSGTTQTLLGVWGSGATNVFAVGQGGTILRLNP